MDDFNVCQVNIALSHLRHSTGERLPDIEPLSRVHLLTEDDVSAAFYGDVVALVSRPIYWKCVKHTFLFILT